MGVSGLTNATDRQAERNNQSVILVSDPAKDLPAPVIDPFDGISKIPLAIATEYVLTNDVLISNGFLLPQSSLPFPSATKISSRTASVITYIGTGPLFSGRDMSGLLLDNLIILAGAGQQLFDCVGNLNSPVTSFSIQDSLFIGFPDIGDVQHFSGLVLRVFLFQAFTSGLRLHNCMEIGVIEFVPITGDKSTTITMTGTSNLIGCEIVITSLLGPDVSVFNIDSGMIFDGVDIRQSQYNAVPTFFQPDVVFGSLTYSDLDTLITDSVTLYEDDGNGAVRVTHSLDTVYLGLSVTHTSLNYNGTFTVIKKFSPTSHVINATYVADEVSGSYVGVGVRVESPAHEFINNTKPVITDTHDYDGVTTILNTQTDTFDLPNVFVPEIETSSFASPGTLPTGCTVDPLTGNLISSDPTTNLIYIHDGISASILSSFATPATSISGVTIDTTTGNLISCDAITDLIYIHDGISVSILSSFAGAETEPRGIAFDTIDNNLVTSYFPSENIYVHSGVTSTTTSTFNVAAAGLLFGLGFDGRNLLTSFTSGEIWVSNRVANPSFKVNDVGFELRCLTVDQPNNDLIVGDTINDEFKILNYNSGGIVTTSSVNEKTIRVNAEANGALQDSKNVAELFLSAPETVTITVISQFEIVAGVLWVPGLVERFTIETNGSITYIGINPITLKISIPCTISKVGGGSDILAARVGLNGVSIAKSNVQTQNASPTSVTPSSLLDVVNGDVINLMVANTGGTSDIVVDSANNIVIATA